MSVNKRTRILHRSKDSEGNNRELDVFEEDTSKQLDVKNANTTILQPNTYSYITFEYEYKDDMPFLWADVYVTNRFTFDTVEETVSFEHAIDTGNAEIYKLANTSLAEPTSYIRISVDASRKRTILEVVLSMADFMFGDIYVQFYRDENDKEHYCAPIIVQFTNAPTIYIADVYKWRPTTSTILPDEDNVFASAFGSVSAGIPDTGRTDVLTGDASIKSEYYNDFMNTNRLITNGLPKDDHSSVSFHPVYVIEYRSFVPSAFSNEFGKSTITEAYEKRNSVGFTFANTSAYLTSAVSVTANDIDEMFKTDGYIAMSGKAVEEHPDFNLPVTNSYSVVGHYKKFNVYLTASDVDDKWLREHTRVCADFALTGIDPYWMSDDKV